MAEKNSGGNRGRQERGADRRRVISALRSTVRLQLLEAIETSPGVDARRLAQAIGSSPPRLYYHLKILTAAGLIRERNGPERQAPRGPSAARYERCGGVDPREFLGEDGVLDEHLNRLREHVLEDGRPSSTLEFAAFHREALLPDEVDRVRYLMQELRKLLSGARARRRSVKSLDPATVFVGLCLVRNRVATLPDLPLNA